MQRKAEIPAASQGPYHHATPLSSDAGGPAEECAGEAHIFATVEGFLFPSRLVARSVAEVR